MTHILTVTLNPALDISTEVDAVLPDVKLRCAHPRSQPGGGGVNVSRAIANLGGTSRALVAVGGGEGRALVLGMRREGLSPLLFNMKSATRSSLAVMDQTTGAQYRFVMPGPEWTAQDCAAVEQEILAQVNDGDLIVPSGSFPPGVPSNFFSDLADHLGDRARVVLDTSGAALAHAAQGQGLFTLRMDRQEARELSGKPLQNITEIAELARDLQAQGAAQVVMIAAGADGNVIATGDGCWHCIPPLVDVVSKVGAGDSFVAGYTLAIAQGQTPLDACTAGTAAATAAVMTPDTDLCDGATAWKLRERVRVVSA